MRLYISLFLVTLCLSSFVRRNLTEEVAKTYTSQIGVREKTGHNDGQEVEKYLKSVSLDKGYAWCAAFIAWTYDQQNIKHPRSAWTPAWFPTANVIYKQGKSTHASVPGRADVFGIYFSQKKGSLMWASSTNGIRQREWLLPWRVIPTKPEAAKEMESTGSADK